MMNFLYRQNSNGEKLVPTTIFITIDFGICLWVELRLIKFLPFPLVFEIRNSKTFGTLLESVFLSRLDLYLCVESLSLYSHAIE